MSWTFGDGRSADLDVPAGFGLSYPARSTVTHTYQRHNAAGYPIAATIMWAVTWSVLSGGIWYGPYALGTQASAPAALAYPVRQAQSELLSS